MSNRFPCLQLEGGLIGADLIDLVADGKAIGQKPSDFNIDSRNLAEEIDALWTDARNYWTAFQNRLARLPDNDSAVSITRDLWITPLLRLLGYELTYNTQAAEVDGITYAISHRAGTSEHAPPVHVIGCRKRLKDRGESSRTRMAAHSLVQEYLNRTEQLWGIVTNGYSLRLLRDSLLIRRLAFVEFDLQRMMEDNNLADFRLMLRLIHRTRLPSGMDNAKECLLEQYYRQTVEHGGRVRDRLRDGLEESLKLFANAFFQHPKNVPLLEKYRNGDFTAIEFYQQLLRLIYRLLFLMVAEERNLLVVDPEADTKHYQENYSIERLRKMLHFRSAQNDYEDLWIALNTLFKVFQDEEFSAILNVSPLNGDLFEESLLLSNLYLTNRDLMSALWHLAMYEEKGRWQRINYAALDVEELGSVYESLLDYHPVISEQSGRLTFNLPSGTERKSTGSYYTPPELVAELIDSALVPIIRERLSKAETIEEKKQAILSIKVCDPACGSGHFLLAAARHLGKELAIAHTGEDEPTPDEQREAIREVIGVCIYGVDKNPLAVDLCKVALWIEGNTRGKPLKFIDHHIRCGDSLAGLFHLSILQEGMPDDAFEPVGHDNNKIARILKRRNRDERAGQHELPFDVSQELHTLAKEQTEIDHLKDGTVAEVNQKKERHRKMRESIQHIIEETACNMWTGAFFTELNEANFTEQLIPTTAALHRYLENHNAINGRMTSLTQALAVRLRFFHWPLEFPDVFKQGGFDVVLGNPPWERIKLQEQEFFATRDPEIANAPNKAARTQLIRNLHQRNPQLWKEYQHALHDADSLSKYLRHSGRFSLTARGDINTYSVFAELVRELLNSKGRAGIILPTGIATDDTTKLFFSDLIEKQSLARLVGFENEAFIFPAVHHAFKFCAMTMTGWQTKIERADFAFFCRYFKDVREEERHFELSRENLALLNPNTRTCPTLRTRTDAELSKQIYRRIPVLINEQSGENPWGVSFMRMFDMTNDSHLFYTRQDLEHSGYKRDSNRYINGNETWVPLYEAKMIYHFDHRYGTYEGATQANLNSGNLPRPSYEQKRVSSFVIQPRYWVNYNEVVKRSSRVPEGFMQAYQARNERLIKEILCYWLAGYHINRNNKEFGLLVIHKLFGYIFDSTFSVAFNEWLASMEAPEIEKKFPLTDEDIEYIKWHCNHIQDMIDLAAKLIEAKCPKWFIGFRDITAAMVERTGVFSLLPQSGIGNTIPVITLNQSLGANLTACLLANLNSLVLDFITRSKLTYIHLSFFVVKQLSVLPPSTYTPIDIEFIAPRVLELIYTSQDMKPFAEDSNYNGEPFQWDEQRRAQLRAELDAYYAKLYGLTRDELRYILDPKEVRGEDFPGETFRVLKEKECKQFGEYRTRRLVLEAWDQLSKR